MVDEFTINGNTYSASLFWEQAQAAYAKTLIFWAQARRHLANGDYISATILSYYSLFHLSLTLMFSCPQYLEKSLRERLVQARKDGSEDPTRKVSHSAIGCFLKDCQARSLSPELEAAFEKAKCLREFVNYGPRIAQRFFRSCKYTKKDVEGIIHDLEGLFVEALKWASSHSAHQGTLIQSMKNKKNVDNFFTNPDFLYACWCPKEVLDAARGLAKKLRAIGTKPTSETAKSS